MTRRSSGMSRGRAGANPMFIAVMVFGLVAFAIVAGVFAGIRLDDVVMGAVWGVVALLSPILPLGLDTFLDTGGLVTTVYALAWTVLAIYIPGTLMVAAGVIWGGEIATALVIAFWLIALLVGE